eukprot:TRINITY_DN5780_c0_g1_i1.p1 TRINITY_DN5780_c0_g1~~TRINITY_DN5780_c0_g1_i1.p1  ORF type:complete len:103 (+),score=30.13 TRINITY_DN5780_c0_g1_i1:281-589(+)
MNVNLVHELPSTAALALITNNCSSAITVETSGVLPCPMQKLLFNVQVSSSLALHTDGVAFSPALETLLCAYNSKFLRPLHCLNELSKATILLLSSSSFLPLC